MLRKLALKMGCGGAAAVVRLRSLLSSLLLQAHCCIAMLLCVAAWQELRIE
jgi:hypothetical protein